MSCYKNILLAVDFHPLCDELIIQRAIEMSKIHNAKLSILHVVEKIHTYGAAEAYLMIIEIEEDLAKEANTVLSTLAAKHHIPQEQQIIEIGDPTWIILEQANKLQNDLIIIGSHGRHGRHGVRLLLGSTANGVLHHAQCDVLAVRVKE